MLSNSRSQINIKSPPLEINAGEPDQLSGLLTDIGGIRFIDGAI